MNKHTLQITADNQPTVMEKLLQVTRYRGFTVTAMNMLPDEDRHQLDIELSVQSDHPIGQLQAQLHKLIDIIQVQIDVNVNVNFQLKIDDSVSRQCHA